MSKTPHINVDYFENLTGKISEQEQTSVEQIGDKIKSIRNKKKLGLSDVAKSTGFDEKFLEDIENNKVQPQLGTIIKLSKALDSGFSNLISGEGDKLYSIIRKEDQETVTHPAAKGGKQAYIYKSLAPEVKGRSMEALKIELYKPSDSEMKEHSGEEFIYVLEGDVELIIDGKTFELNPGDSAYYSSTMPHLIGAKKEKALIIAVMYGG
ncbi:MAG: cupin domain-containing protein [Deltaproteobacteria bacterium]|nr:cupin domain-containing protein [Deltaproteobacteria bacterium]